MSEVRQLSIDEAGLGRHGLWFRSAPEWLVHAYHNDPLVNVAIKQSYYQGFDDNATLLNVVLLLLRRDRERVKTINELQMKVPIIVPYCVDRP